MKVSVIVPIFNVKEYLYECVQSVINQTYRDIEIILINDGSNDGSGELCDKLVKEYAGLISVIHQENMGPFPARMAGVRKAEGDIIVFLDGDDVLAADALEKITNAFTQYNCDLVMYTTKASEKFPCNFIEQSLKENYVYEKEEKKILYKKLLLGQIANGVCFKAIKRKCINIDGDIADLINLKYGEDLLMSAYFLTYCESAVYINEGLYYYRAREGSAIHTFDVKRKESIKRVHTELSKCIENWNMPEIKPTHNSRKVKGWVEVLTILLKNKKALTKSEFKNQLKSMAEDNYFREAYRNMDTSLVSKLYKILAFCLYKKMYAALNLISVLKR